VADFHRLFDHLVWADDRVRDALRACSAPPPRAVELYAHILGAEEVWLSRLAGSTSRLAVWPAVALGDLEAAARDAQRGWRDFLQGLASPDLHREVAYVNSAGQAFSSRVLDIILHVCLHGAYHRGQIALLLRGIGAAPAPTDYIAFVRGAPAATRR